MIKSVGNLCCGCSACAQICPKNCIVMEENEEGFLFPCIDEQECIKCNVCKNVCPILNKQEKESLQKAYVVRNSNEQILMNSASGGFFSAIAETVLESDGVVCAATYNEDWKIVHKITSNTKDINQMRGSKYVQSDMSMCFKEIKRVLLCNKQVLFCGTPCQVQALNQFVDDSLKSTLITVDLVCKGVGSPGFWKKYLEYQKKLYKANIININFRKKVHGYHSSNLNIDFDNEKHSCKSKTDIFMKAYVNECCSRPSCYTCQFKGINRCSDFTIFDAWSAEWLVDEMEDDDNGYTTVIVHSEKAAILLNALEKKLFVYPINTESAIELDGKMIWHQPTPNLKRKAFLCMVMSDDIRKAMQHYCKITWKDNVIEIGKHILHCFGLLGIVKTKLKKRA